jgi:hypothetical protein
MGRLQKIAAPNLPLAQAEYGRQYQDQLNNVLRLYFNLIDSSVNNIIGVNGGQFVDCPSALFFNTADQTFALANTAYPVVFNQTYLNNAVALVSGSTSRVGVTVAGIYNFQYTAQLLSTNSSAKTVYIWISRNGVDIGFSTRAITLAANNEYAEANWSFNIDLDEGEYIELRASVTDTNVEFRADAASAPHPGIPSSVLSVNFIAPLPVPRPTPP